ncbi:MAG: DUF4143 domain-containing protein [Deltaproteobacteria bacterium]|nr:DUF4143 domain-containing protein [Deltaproteobacteria bacterium]
MLETSNLASHWVEVDATTSRLPGSFSVARKTSSCSRAYAGRSPDELFHWAERGAVFGSFLVSGLYKNSMHRGEQPSLHFWRTASGHEVDIIIELGLGLILVETKSGQTIASDSFDALTCWREVSGNETGAFAFIYVEDRSFNRSGVGVYPWFAL